MSIPGPGKGGGVIPDDSAIRKMAARWIACFKKGIHPSGTTYLYCSYQAPVTVVEMVSEIQRAIDCQFDGNPVNWYIADSLRQIVIEKDLNQPDFILDDWETRLKRFYGCEYWRFLAITEDEGDIFDNPENNLISLVLVSEEKRIREKVYFMVLSHLRQAVSNQE